MSEIATPRLPRRAPRPRMSAVERQQATKGAILDRDGHRCAYCGCSLRYTTTPCEYEPGVLMVHGNIPTLDHVVPKCRGGSNRAENLVASCIACNSQKGAMTGEEYSAWKAARA